MMRTGRFPSVKSLTARVAGLRLLPRVAPEADPARSADRRPAPDCPPGSAPPCIDIPMRDASPASGERARHMARGRYLARQEAWSTLADEIAAADLGRTATTGGTPVARLLAEGAHADTLENALAAVDRNDPTSARRIVHALQDGIDGIGDRPHLVLIPGLAHLAVARAWEGRPGAPDPTPLRRDARAQHLESAQRLIDRHDPLEQDSPALAALRCAVLDLQPRPASRVSDDYEDLIDLDPACFEHMRAFGRDLMPTRFGNWEKLDLEARRTAGRSSDIWGTGAYAWVWFDVLATDPDAFDHVDAELFAEALHDILERRPDQYTANLLAAYCGLTLSGAAQARSARARIAGCFDWIVQDHLREVHPDLWALARPVPGVEDLGISLRRGQVRALSTLGEHFARHLARGRQVIFHEGGVELRPSGCASCPLAPCSALAFPKLVLAEDHPAGPTGA